MFIPRTLASSESTGRGAWARAAIVGGFLALALFAVLSVSVGSGQVNLAPGDVANTDITAPYSQTFFSESLTNAARTAAADAVPPVYEEIAPRADIRDRQLRVYDNLARSVRTILIQRDAATIEADEVLARLSSALPAFTDDQITLIASLPVDAWGGARRPAGRRPAAGAHEHHE
jgi:membrane-associated HD superfamily phosphohydrolase